MGILRDVGRSLQTLLGPSLDGLARDTGVVRRLRKFSGSTLLRTIVLTAMKSPGADAAEYAATAAKLGVVVTPEAVARRFTPRLVEFLRAALGRAIADSVAAPPAALGPLGKFTSVRIGDSTQVALPEELAGEYPGCGGAGGSGKASLKLQVLWDLLSGELITLELTPGRDADARSVLARGPAPAGSLTILDLGYFRLDRFAELAGHGGHWIARYQRGTAAFDADGRPIDLLARLGRHPAGTPLDMPALLGAGARLPCRLIALRAPAEVASRRRRAAAEKAGKHGRRASPEHLAWCDWTVYVTSCPAGMLTWKEAVVLYRARWQVELMFKLWKSHGGLGRHDASRPAHRQMAGVLAVLIGSLVRHRVLLGCAWADPRRSLWKAARVVRGWVELLAEALDDADRLATVLERIRAAIEAVARVDRRGKHPSSFQLLDNPELLEYSP